MMNDQARKEFLDRVALDAERAFQEKYQLPLVLDLATLLSVIANLQLALRHPGIPRRRVNRRAK